MKECKGLEDVMMMTPMGARGLAGSPIRPVEGELPITKGPDDTLPRLSHHYLLLTVCELQWCDGNDEDEKNNDYNPTPRIAFFAHSLLMFFTESNV